MPRKSNAKSSKELMTFDVNLGEVVSASISKGPIEQRAVIYCRVSDMSQVNEGFGLEGQERYCKEWCETNGIIIDKVFIEPGISGANLDRQQFNACLKYLKEQNKAGTRITQFVASEASRISRHEDITESLLLENKLKESGVKIVTLDMPFLDDSTDEGAFIKTVQYAAAALERKKIMKRVHNGKVNRLKNGFRPFNKPPVGYLRHKDGVKNYTDKIDPDKGPIMKEGLELFAKDILQTQSDLRKFRNEKGLLSSESNTKKLQKTFTEKTLKLHRIIFYAGYIIYPRRGINTPIKANHIGLISLETAHQIIKKVQGLQSKYTNVNRSISDFTNEHPLKGAIYCPHCARKYSARTTTRYKTNDDGERTKKSYPYYGCANNNCSHRTNISKAVLEQEFETVLEKISIPEKMKILIDIIFAQEREKSKKLFQKQIGTKKQSIKKLQKKLEQIEEALIRTTNPGLYSKLEEEWNVVNQQRKNLLEQEDNAVSTEQKMEQLLQKTHLLFNQPRDLRHIGSQNLRLLLVKVRFGGKLLYSKESGLRTSENSLLYDIFKGFRGQNSSNRQQWEKDRTNRTTYISNLQTAVEAQSHDIEVARRVIEYEGLGYCDEQGIYHLTLELQT